MRILGCWALKPPEIIDKYPNPSYFIHDMTRVFLLFFLLATTACNKNKKTFFDVSAQEWFEKGQKHMAKKETSDAIECFEKVIQLYPYDALASQAQILLIKANRENGTHQSAIANADVFLQIYPAHKQANEVILLKALSFFDQVTGDREDSQAENALATLKFLEQRDPKYLQEKRESAERVLNNIVASGKIKNAHTSVARKALFSAIHLYMDIVTNYGNNRFVPEAYYRLVECYQALGLHDEALYAASQIPKQTQWHALAHRLIERKKRG